jgi:hypothetical protein
MTHSQTISTRRRKEKAKKELARIAKQAKKTGKQTVKPGKAVTPKAGAA